MKYFFYLLLFLLLLPASTSAQQGFGMRFASNINYFPRHEEFDLLPGSFTSGVFGVFYRTYNAYGGLELGLNANYKNFTGKGLPNFPVVMQDFNTGKKAGFTALELDLKVGPRFGAFNPKIGYIFGYRFKQSNFTVFDPLPDTISFNKLYMLLPFGASFDFFTGFGTVGIGAYYNVGILNVRHSTPNYNRRAFDGGIYPGGKWSSFNFEITVTFNTRNQGKYFDPDVERIKLEKKNPPIEEEENKEE